MFARKEAKGMTKRWMFILVLLLAIPGLLFVASCAKKTIKSDPGTTMTGGEAGSQADDRAKQQALKEQRLQEERLRREAKERRALAEVAPVVQTGTHHALRERHRPVEPGSRHRVHQLERV